MAIQQNWKIRKRAEACHHNEFPFKEEDFFYTGLFLEEDEEGLSQMVRRDYSAAAWEELENKLTPYSFWRSRFEPTPVVEEDPTLQKENAEGLLRRLIDEDNPSTENARYILAIMLERKKMLVQTDVKEAVEGEEGSENRILIYEHRLGGDILLVRDPLLRLDEIESVQNEVSVLLGGKPKEPAPEAGENSNAVAEVASTTETESESEAAPPVASSEEE